MSNENYYRQKVTDIFKALDTGENGISNEEARERINKYGKNELVAGEEISKWALFFAQFKDVLMILLLVAAGMSFIIQNYRDGIVMLMITIINGIIGFFQEYKAEQIMASLDKLVKSPAKIIRDGNVEEIPQEELVVGDIVVLDEGDKVPADLRIIESYNLKTNDVSLTGESLPQEKNSNVVSEEKSLADRANMAYLGTNVASGSAKGIVVKTGMDTEMGKIASMTQEEEKSQSPLQAELAVVANRIAVFAIFIGAILFGISIYRGLGLNFALIYGLGVAVAVVPQALPMQITVALSQGVKNLADRNAVVKKLSSVETLGSTNVISTDKTGTLTKNEMTVKKVWFDGSEYEITGLGYKPEGNILNSDGEKLSDKEIDELEIMFDAATMASNAEIHPPDDNHSGWYPIGDPTEAALITLSTKLGTRSPKEDEENPELHEFSFDSVRKRMSSVREFEEGNILTMKGAIDSVLSISKHIYKDGKKVEITDEDKKGLNKINENYSKKAMRVLAIAYRELGEDETDYVIEEIERDVVFLGLVAMIDPPKEGVKEAIEKSHLAHLDTFIMTGDHAITAKAVGEAISLATDEEDVPVLTSKDLDTLSDDALKEMMEENESLIFSRVSPEDKLRIVKNLKAMGKIVAVTGDGVNDAPALKSAHIGVAMGQMGTDVSKEAAELILLDDSYPTLVHAIRKGRTIYNNLKKTVLASLTTNGAELAIVLLGMLFGALFGWPIPILTIQILSIDLLAEILPLTAFTYDPGSKTLMTSPPRRRDEHIVNKKSITEILFLAVLMGGLAFANFGLFNKMLGGNLTEGHEFYARATTISYLTLAFCQWINIMSRRYEFTTIFNKNFFSNKKMLYSILISIGMVLIVIYTPYINSYLGFAGVTPGDWLRVFAAGAVFLSAHEIIKLLKKENIRE
ncbi:MAG: cation-translocating P-type ATPase [Halothermotrichaceae bacterium]